MSSSPPPSPAVDLEAEVARLVEEYRSHDDLGQLFDALKRLAASADADALQRAAAPFRDQPAVVIPLYERIVAQRPGDAQAMVVLANAYWVTGRGPDVVGALAKRAIEADATNRGAWHLWALAESNVRGRMERWQQVAERFPSDQLARAALADNAASLAGAEHDPIALALAITTYEGLLRESVNPSQAAALRTAIDTLRAWKL